MLEQNRRATPTRPVDLDRTQLLSRICVRPPYFAIDQLQWFGDAFWATAVAERAQTNEVGPMQACEISRHAAICGLSAVALTAGGEDRHYYLAQDATYLGFANPAPYGAAVSFEARVVDQNRRQATAEISVTAGGEALASLQVTYTILGEASFKRLFRSKYAPGFTARAYERMPDPPVGVRQVVGDTSVLTLDHVPEEACAGHFEHYPAMPVAVLMGQLGLVAGQQYGAPYWVEAATMSASDFCWAGETARFEVTALSEPGRYHCVALASDVVVSEMTLQLGAARAGS